MIQSIARPWRVALVATLGLPLVLLATAPPVADAALVRYDFETLTSRSSHIVRGRVTSIRSSWWEFGTLGTVLVTDVTIRVGESWKGAVPLVDGEHVLTVRYLGGDDGDFWQRCPESPEFTRDEEVLVFARGWRGALWTTGWLQGKYTLAPASSTTPAPSGDAGIEGAADDEAVSDADLRLHGKTGAPLRGLSLPEVKAAVLRRAAASGTTGSLERSAALDATGSSSAAPARAAAIEEDR